MKLRRTLAVAFAGLVAGLVAALALTLTQLLMREWFGISPPQEMIPDRFAPTLDVDRFVELVNQYGYNDLKRFGIQAGLTGVLAVGTLVGIAYALVSESAASRTSRRWWFGLSGRGLAFVGIAFAALYVGSLIVLWPTLDTNHRGLPPSDTRWATAGGYCAAFALYAVVLVAVYRLLVRRATPA